MFVIDIEYTVLMWWSEDSFVRLVFSLHVYVSSGDTGVWVCMYVPVSAETSRQPSVLFS